MSACAAGEFSSSATGAALLSGRLDPRPPVMGTRFRVSAIRCTAACSHSFWGNPASITPSRNSMDSWSCSSVGSFTDVSNVHMRARIVRLSWSSSSAYAVSPKNLRWASVGSETGLNDISSMTRRNASLNATHRASFSFLNVEGLMTMRGPPPAGGGKVEESPPPGSEIDSSSAGPVSPPLASSCVSLPLAFLCALGALAFSLYSCRAPSAGTAISP